MKVLADFEELTKAEGALVKWLQAGNRKFFRVSNSVPNSASDDVTLRATFIRYLALGGCDACRLPETGLRVIGAHIDGDDTHSSSTKGLDFQGATLPYDLALISCHIPDPIILRSAKVKNLFLDGSTIASGIVAVSLQADGKLSLLMTKVTGEVNLRGARLVGDLDCRYTTLCANVDEEKSRAGNALFCDGLQTESAVLLGGATITGATRLVCARIGVSLQCDGATLRADEDALICDGVVITNGLFLRDGTSVIGGIRLIAANIGAISDDPSSWPDSIRLDRCRYGAFLGDETPTDAKSRLDWLARIPSEAGVFKPDPYEHCAKVLREMGHGAEATKILIEKERLQRQARRAQLRRAGQAPLANLRGLSDWILGITTRYGRQPLWAFVWLLGFWAFGALMFDQAAQRGEIKPNLPQIQRAAEWVDCADGAALRLPEHAHQPACFHAQPEGQSHPRFNAIFYSADTLFPVVALEMQSYWIPDDTKPFGKYARWYLWAHIIAGWALTLLAVAGFSGLIKTDNTK